MAVSTDSFAQKVSALKAQKLDMLALKVVSSEVISLPVKVVLSSPLSNAIPPEDKKKYKDSTINKAN